MASSNPLFHQPDDSKEPDENASPDSYLLPSSKKKIVPTNESKTRNAAANVIREKLAAIYAGEPAIKQELAELAEADKPLSKHQKALSEIQNNAKSVAEIQIKWHEYYAELPEHEKHEVWQEFYTEQAKHSRYANFMAGPASTPTVHHEEPKRAVVSKHEPATDSARRKRLRDARTTNEVKDTVRRKVETSRRKEAKSPLHSVLFGLSMGALVLLVMLFGLFNEMIIAPFIQPSRHVSATPIIIGNGNVAADGTSKIIIPKINVEIPVNYDVASMAEKDIQDGLENGVVHYPTTVRPGEKGNAAFFGHSSNNIFNPGQYKFAFVLLSRLEPGDTFYLTYNKTVYSYKVFDKKIVDPSQVEVLNPVAGKAATAALITCDPPGTTLHRLVVWGEQVSPDPSGNATGSGVQVPATDSQELTGAPESLWQRIINSIF